MSRIFKVEDDSESAAVVPVGQPPRAAESQREDDGEPSNEDLLPIWCLEGKIIRRKNSSGDIIANCARHLQPMPEITSFGVLGVVLTVVPGEHRLRTSRLSEKLTIFVFF